MFARIVLAVDGSEISARAVAVCADLAARLGAAVTAVHVTADPMMLIPPVAPAGGMVAPPVIPEETIEELEQAGRALLDQAERTLRQAGVRAVATRLLQGAAAPQIVAAAREVSADLIVLGSRGHSKLEELLLGSVSDAVVREAPCSVLVVR